MSNSTVALRVADDADYPASTTSVPPMPGCRVQTNAYSPGSGALNSTVSEVPGATIVDVATLIGPWKVRLCGTDDRFSKVSRMSAPA